MSAIRSLAVALVAVLSTQVIAGSRHHHVELVNRAQSSVTAIAVAAAGSDAFRDVALASPVRGGGGATAIEVAGDDCRVDLRYRFLDGRSAISRNVDICRTHGFRIQPLPQASETGSPADLLGSR